MARLVSERIGQFFIESDRLEYTEYGAGDRWVVLIHGQLMPRRMHEPLARAIAAEGFHVVTVDLLGHGRWGRTSRSRWPTPRPNGSGDCCSTCRCSTTPWRPG